MSPTSYQAAPPRDVTLWKVCPFLSGKDDYILIRIKSQPLWRDLFIFVFVLELLRVSATVLKHLAKVESYLYMSFNKDDFNNRPRRLNRRLRSQYLSGRSNLDGDTQPVDEIKPNVFELGRMVLRRGFRRIREFSPLHLSIAGAILLAVIVIPIAIAVNAGGGDPNKQAGTSPLPGVMTSTSPTPVASPTPTISPSPSPSPEPTPTPPPHPSTDVLKEGVTAPVVIEIQERLMKLGYMEEDEPTDYFGSITKSALLLFQRQHELDMDGKIGSMTYDALMSDQAQHYTVMQGASGVDVRELQKRLRELGYMDEVTSFFGDITVEAVKNFQKYNKLTVDGKVGRKTRELIYSQDAQAYFMKYGEKSDEVKSYQKRLQTLGYLVSEPDGNYGKDTVAAVSRFQELNGIIADGFLGPQTTSALTSSKAKANALMFGMSGNDVKSIQTKLKKLGYMSNVTGYFGSETESAVESFQKRNSLGVDGTVGKVTMATLNSSKAKAASTGGSSSGGSSSGGSSGGSSSSGSSSSAASSKVEKMISAAESKLGSKYVFASKGPSTFDCSGFVYYCLNQAGANQSYMTSSAWAGSSKYPKITNTSNLQRGDILVFKGHVGIYMGNGKMIDASSSKGKVVTRTGIWSSSYWNRNFICGFRVF